MRALRFVALAGASFLPAVVAGAEGLAGTPGHGDEVRLPSPFSAAAMQTSFIGGVDGLIERTDIAASPPSEDGWIFNMLGGVTSVRIDAARDKVLFTPQDNQNYNATRRYDPGFALAQQRHIYKAHWVRNRLLLDGEPYALSYQWKHERLSWQNSVTDTNGEFKVHNWPGSQGPITFLTRADGSGQTWWGGHAGDSNADWALLEMFVFTGTDGMPDGRVLTRVHKNGQTRISQNRRDQVIHSGPQNRLRYFVEQNYFGNWAQIEYGVDNNHPRPQVRELWSDDSLVQIGLDASSGWQRVELRDAVDLRDAGIRELQGWRIEGGDVVTTLNTGGIAPGEHALYLVMIDGVDADGWDQVLAAHPVLVRVASPILFRDGFEPGSDSGS